MSYDRRRKDRITFDDDDRAIDAALVREQRERPAQTRCARTNKFIWLKRSGAEAAAKSQRSRQSDPFLVVYQCAHCGGFHIGHPRGTERARMDLVEAVRRDP